MFSREFLIMYRKMIFILITTLPMIENDQKSLILLLLITISACLTYYHKPFTLFRLNDMEQKSNLAAVITIFAGCLYVLSVHEIIKAFAFLAIAVYNLGFLFLWLVTVINIYVNVYSKKIFKFCPKLMNFLAILQKTANSTEFQLNLHKYAKSFYNNFRENTKQYSLNKF